MNTFVKVTFAVGVPLMLLLGMSDMAATFYRPAEPEQLGYQVVEPEEIEEEVVEDEPVEEAAAAEEEPAAEEVAEVAAEEEAPAEEAVAESTVEEEAPVEETPVADAASEDAPVEETEVAEAVTEEAEVVEDDAAPITIALTDDEMKQAERAMRKCSSCHQLNRERNAAGPHLVGVMGRQIASIDGFRYSDALTALGDAGEVWNPENLQVWIENPGDFADGTRMNFKVSDE